MRVVICDVYKGVTRYSETDIAVETVLKWIQDLAGSTENLTLMLLVAILANTK